MFKVENTRQIPPQLIDSGRKLIQEVLNEVSGIDFVMLCSSDGFELGSVENYRELIKLAHS